MALRLNMLPLSNFSNPTQTAIAARDKWNETRIIVNEIRSSGFTLGAQLQQSLDNLKYFIDSAMNAIHTFETNGGSLSESALQVNGLEGARQGFLAELPKTKALFAQFQTEANVDTGTAFVQSVTKLTEPPSESKLIAVGLLVGALWVAKVALFD